MGYIEIYIYDRSLYIQYIYMTGFPERQRGHLWKPCGQIRGLLAWDAMVSQLKKQQGHLMEISC
jgi:hypothetical protein